MKSFAPAIALITMSSLATNAQTHAFVLGDVNTVSVTATVIGDSRKVANPSAGAILETALRNALIASGLRVGESPVRMYLVLDEFSAGNAAKRAFVGFGSGRSTVSARLIVERDDAPAAAIPIRTRGRLMFSAYQGDDAQQRHALNEFEKRLAGEIAALRSRE